MPNARFTERLPHAPADMLDLVTSVEQYPEFLSFVAGLRVLGQKRCTPTGEIYEAEMAISYKMISENVRCIVEINSDAKTVRVRKADKSGPIKTLLNDWTFYELPDGSTLVDLVVDVTLKSMPLNFLVKQKFGEASEKIMAAFTRRAAQRYSTVGNEVIDVEKEAAALGLKGFA